MSRPLRLEYAGALYHLTSRGNAQQDIFRDDTDRRAFLRLLGETVTQFGWQLYAYCLMGNHYHLFAETPAPNLSRGMHRLNGKYTQWFNRRHTRVGHLFQGRFESILVERESHMLELARYVALNPVRAGMVGSPEQWPWSSYRSTAGLEPAATWLGASKVLECFANSQSYQAFVLAGMECPSPWSRLRGQAILGTDEFAERLRSTFAAQRISAEMPRATRLAPRARLEALLPPEERADHRKRNAAIREAHRQHGYTLAEIARHTRLHYSTVSRIAAISVQQFKT